MLDELRRILLLETLKELLDSEGITFALFQRLQGVESERSFFREVALFFWHLFPGVVGLQPSSLCIGGTQAHRRYFEPLRRTILPVLVASESSTF